MASIEPEYRIGECGRLRARTARGEDAMRVTTRAVAVGLGLLVALAAAAPATAQQSVRLGHLFPATHFEGQGLSKLADLIGQKTGGKLKVEVFPASQMGSETEQTEQVRSGALHMHSSGGSIQQYVPELQILGLPGLWKSHDHVQRVVTGEVGKQLAEMAEKKNVGIKVLTFSTMGERYYLGRKRPALQTSDFAGVKIRVDTQPASAAIWRAVNANPVPIAFAEVYSSLQTGVIDAAEQPPCGVLSMKFYEQAKYITTTAHQLTLMAVQVNQRWYDGLPADTRAAVKAAVDEWVPLRYQMAKEAEAGCIAKLKEFGAEIHALKDPDAFRAALTPIQKEFGDKHNLNDLIARIKAVN
jgi:tripartite ATP-independent transporter DctP family solute receptor